MNALSDVVAARVRSIRRSRGWSVQHLADRCAELGAPELTSRALYVLEGPRRRKVTVDEAAIFARVFGVDITTLLTPATCERCNGAPPEGFSCNECGRDSA